MAAAGWHAAGLARLRPARCWAAAALLVLLVSGSPGSAQVFDSLQALNTNAASDSENDLSPEVATDGAGTWVAVWHSRDTLGGAIGTDMDILVARSSDGGATWTAPAALGTHAASDSGDDFDPQVATDGTGSWLAVWESGDSLGGTIGTDRDILVARSSDAEATWTAPAALGTNAASDSGWDISPQVTTNGAESWVAVWASHDSLGGTIGTDYDILVARSSDAGAIWTAPAALGGNAASDSGADRAPQVATDGAGSWVAVWHSNGSLGATIGTDYDILFALGSGPDLDGDGLSDGAEVNVHGTDPLDPDTDDDGLSDGDEVDVHGTDPLDVDTDGDGYSDGYEVATGTDPLDRNSRPVIPVPALTPFGRGMALLLLVLAGVGWLARRRAS
jgi:hypothetical protein